MSSIIIRRPLGCAGPSHCFWPNRSFSYASFVVRCALVPGSRSAKPPNTRHFGGSLVDTSFFDAVDDEDDAGAFGEGAACLQRFGLGAIQQRCLKSAVNPQNPLIRPGRNVN